MQIWCRQRENGNHFKYSSYAKRTMVTSAFLVVYLLSVLTVTVCTKDDDKTVFSGKIMPFERYKRLFVEHRRIQLEAVKSLQGFDDNTRKYKLVDVMLQKLFLVLGEAKQNLTQWGFVPGTDPFPENETVREAFSKVVENTAMFGDLVLRLPDVVHGLFDKNTEWNTLMGWCVWFSVESKVFDGGSEKTAQLNSEMKFFKSILIYPMSQEINLIPKEDDYINPFTEENQKLKEKAMKEVLESSKSKGKSKSTKKI
ncbi:Coiled-coil domain-containing protein 134 [Mytilus edulis]|uniref:Coiled-coil domain-containing protein 134 n=1 Tax=Mytilus edulis TaxID=6550 RepID=A0A8S3T3Y7_MYTED|nr:Coiled-coil domain-containing protein 134 [Mytilus edulis]